MSGTPSRPGAASLPGEVHVLADPEATAEAAARWVADAGAAGVAARGAFHLALAGGGTPERTYRHLSTPPLRDAADWGRWWLWFGDERAVPPDDEQSNFHLARRALISRLVQPPASVMRMPGERPDLEAAAADYAAALSAHLPAGPAGAPRFDLVLLGLGTNGHTASLFPGDPSLEVTDAWAVHSRADYAPYDRITLTFPVLDAARAVAFLVTGGEKGEALGGVIAGTVPASRVRPDAGALHWFLDREAADSVS